MPTASCPKGPKTLAAAESHGSAFNMASPRVTGSLHQTDLATGRDEAFDLPGRPGFAIPCQTEGRYLVGMDNSLGYYDTTDRSWTPFRQDVDSQITRTIINDGVAFGDNLIFGTKELTFTKTVAGLFLYRGSDLALFHLRDDQICSNGKVVVEHGRGHYLYDIDSPTKKVVRYELDLAAGEILEPTTIIDLGDEPAVPGWHDDHAGWQRSDRRNLQN